jgi:membrane protein DedA with SNARE-associated domain
MSADALLWYASIFFWMLFSGIGIPPCPEEAGILYAAGVTAVHPEVYWWLAWPLTSAGIVSADVVLYGIGRLWGQRLFEFRWVRWVLKPERRQRLERRFHNHGIKLLIAARFLPPLRTGVFMVAGTIRFSFARFLAADVIFAVLGVGALFFCGTWVIALLHQLGHWVLFVLAPLVALYALYRYFRFLKRRELQGLPEPPISVLEIPLHSPPANGPASPPKESTPQSPERAAR